jgi:hypothetical protein
MTEDEKPPPPPPGNFIGLDLTDLVAKLIEEKLLEAEQEPEPPGKPGLRIIKGGKA